MSAACISATNFSHWLIRLLRSSTDREAVMPQGITITCGWGRVRVGRREDDSLKTNSNTSLPSLSPHPPLPFPPPPLPSPPFPPLTCTLATLGGSMRPLLSPCTIVMTPMVRVVRPHEFWYAYSCSPSCMSCVWVRGGGGCVMVVVGGVWAMCEGYGKATQHNVARLSDCVCELWPMWTLTCVGLSKTISNILEKFWPRWCEVAACRTQHWPIKLQASVTWHILHHQPIKSQHQVTWLYCPIRYLNSPPTGGYKGLNGSSIIASCKLLFHCLASRDNWNSQQLLVHSPVQL